MKRVLVLEIQVGDERPDLCGASCPLLIDLGHKVICGAFNVELAYASGDNRWRDQRCLEAAYRRENQSES